MQKSLLLSLLASAFLFLPSSIALADTAVPGTVVVPNFFTSSQTVLLTWDNTNGATIFDPNHQSVLGFGSHDSPVSVLVDNDYGFSSYGTYTLLVFPMTSSCYSHYYGQDWAQCSSDAVSSVTFNVAETGGGGGGPPPTGGTSWGGTGFSLMSSSSNLGAAAALGTFTETSGYSLWLLAVLGVSVPLGFWLIEHIIAMFPHDGKKWVDFPAEDTKKRRGR